MSSDHPPKPELYYFCDETSFVGEEYMAVAGLAIDKSDISEVAKGIKKINEDHSEWGEVKWQSTRINFGLDVRKAYVDFLVRLVRENRAHFHIRFAPFKQYDHTQSGKRRIYDTVSKMYYQLLLHRAVKNYGSTRRMRIRPDDGECTSELVNFVDALHTDGQRKYLADRDCIIDIVCLNSRREQILQLLDVPLGALTAYRNGRHELETTSEAKRELAIYAHGVFGVEDLTKNYDDGRKLSIWNVVPKTRGPRS